MFPATNKNEVTFLFAPAGDRVLFRQNSRYYNVLQGVVVLVPSLPKACDVLLRIRSDLLDLFSPDKETQNSNSNISKNSSTTTTSFVSRKYMEKTSFFKLSRCWLRDFDFLVPFLLTMRMREDRPFALTGIFCLKKRDCDSCGFLSRP